MTTTNTNYRWPDLSPVQRQYVVCDNQGRIGIAHTGGDNMIWAHPANVPTKMDATAKIGLPSNAVLITDTSWHIQKDGSYKGSWFDANSQTAIVIIDDLGYRIPDKWADVALVGSDQSGHWDYGATLGKIGGESPVKGQKSNEMTVEQAQDYAKEVGEQVTARGIRLAAQNGYIPNARKIGRDWLITYDGFNYYLDHRPNRGPKSKALRP